MNWCPDVLNARPVSLLAAARAAALDAPWDNIRMRPDKDLASSVLSAAGPAMKAQSLRMTVYLFAVMEPTALPV